jgi:protein-tyrosine phosphatase
MAARLTLNRVNEVFWINGDRSPHLAIVMRPRGEDWLHDEMRRMRANGIETVISMLESHEAEWLGLAAEQTAAERVGMEFLNFPIPDTQVPLNVAAFRAFVADVARRLGEGEHVGVHCRGCIGRATILAACVLVRLGRSAADALEAIENVRGEEVPDTPEQAEWIKKFRP